VNNIKVNERKACRICGSGRLDRYLSLPSLPLTDEFLLSSDKDDSFQYPIDIFLCTDCGLSQTQHDVDMGQYYKDYSYTSGPSEFARNYMNKLADTVCRRWDVGVGSNVVEIGSGDGAQLSFFKARGAEVLGFEPSEQLAAQSRTAGIPVINRIFDKEAVKDIPDSMCPVQTMLLTYTFDHLPDPSQFLASVAPILDADKGVLIIEVHDLEKIFERREFCLFEHEHSVYPTASMMQRILSNAGFTLIEVGLLPESERRANSLVVVATPHGSGLAKEALKPLPREICLDAPACHTLGSSITQSIDRFRDYISEQRSGGRLLAGYGAGGRGVMTLAAVARPGEFEFVCDRNPAFHNRYTPMTGILVVPPEYLFEHHVDEVIVFSFGYMDEIKKFLTPYTQKGGKITSLLELI